MVPGAVFMLLPALSNLDPALEEAALTSGVTRAVAFRRITLPLLLPAVLAVGVFYFIIAIEMFDFVAIIGVPGDVIVQRIYRALTDNRGGVPGYGRAGVLGLILFAVCAIAIAYYVRLLRDARRFAVVGGKRRQAAPIPLGRWHIAASALALLWLTLAVVLPVITLVWVAVTPFFGPPTAETLATLNLDGFRDAIDYLPEPLGRTALVMVGTIVGAIAMGLSLSWVVTRRRDRLARAADGLVFLAPAVPTVVVATAFQILGLGLYQWVPLYGTVALMVAAMSTRLLAYTTRTMNAAALQLAPELEEAAVTSGVSPGRTFAAVFAPLMRPAIFYAALMAGMLAARDLTLPLIMGAGREPLLSVLIYDLQTNGEYASAAGIALILIVMLVGLAVAARRLTGLGEGGERA
jgi:iron(III) transport system permease protein